MVPKPENLSMSTFCSKLLWRFGFSVSVLSELTNDILMTTSSLQIPTDLNAVPAGLALFDAPVPTMITSCPGPVLIAAIGIGS